MNDASAAQAGSPHPLPEGEGAKSGAESACAEPSPQPSPGGRGSKTGDLHSSQGRGTGSAGPQAQRPPRGAGSDTKCATVGAIFQHGAAILSAMLTVTLVATFAAAALWQQWRSVEVEAAERARVQSNWILTGALDWSRLILREDARSGGADHLAEPWAVPLSEARLSSFLSVDKNASDTEREAFLSGRISDLQARLNVANLVEGGAVSPAAKVQFTRLFELLGLPIEELTQLAQALVDAAKSNPEQAAATPPAGAASSPATATAPVEGAVAPQPAATAPPLPDGPNALTPLFPQRIEQLVWLGLSPQTLAVLMPYITLLPTRTTVNVNTASAQVISASTPGLDMATALSIVGTRDRSHFRTLADAGKQLGRDEVKFSETQHSVASRFFEVHGQLRLDQTTVEERSVLQRDGLVVTTIWRERGVSTAFAAGAPRRP